MQSILFLTVGLPGSGKTTRAFELEAKYNALRLSKDEWVLKILGENSNRDRADALSPIIENQLWLLALRALDLGNNVVVDFGLWSIEERARFREEGERHGARVYFISCEDSFETLWERVRMRIESQSGTLHITYEDMKDFWDRFQPITDEEQQYVYRD